jgi:hypothetical protein
MLTTIEFYEIMLGCPPLAFTDPSSNANPIAHVLGLEQAQNRDMFLELQRNALKNSPYPAIYRNNILAVGDRADIVLPVDNVRSLVVMPCHHNIIICVAGNRLFSINLDEKDKVEEIKGVDPANVTSIIVHPTFNLYMTISVTSLVLYEQQHGYHEYKFKLSSERINCGAWSPNGSKLAICTDVIDVFSFDLSKSDATPAHHCDIKCPINAVAWINSDTMLAVGYSQNGVGNLVIVDTLSRYQIPVEVKKEWGGVSAISVDSRRGRLIFGTRSGHVVISDLKDNYKHICIYALGSAVTSISALNELFVVSAEDGSVIPFSTAEPNPGAPPRKTVDFRLSCVSVVPEMIVAAGESNKLVLWRAI